MKKFSESFGNIAPPAATQFSDQVFYYSLGAGSYANCPVPVGASYVEITASQFVTVSPQTVSGAPASTPTATSGYQTVNLKPGVTSGAATGLNNDSTLYTATFNIDGTNIPWYAQGSAIQTYAALVSSFNTTLASAASAAFVNGNIVVTSASTGVASKVLITSAPVVTPTPSVTPSVTVTATLTATPTLTASPSVTHSVSPTITNTPSVTPSVTDSPGITRTPSPTPTITNSATPTPTTSHTPSVTPSVTVSVSVTASTSLTPTVTPTVTTSHSVSPTVSVTPSQVGSGVFSALPMFASFAAPVAGGLTSQNAEVVLTTVKQLNNTVATIGVYSPTSSTMVSLAFYG